jgi:hypothetical protein
MLFRALSAAGPWGLAASAIVGALTASIASAFMADPALAGLFASRLGLLTKTIMDFVGSLGLAIGGLDAQLGIGGMFASLLTFWTGGVALFLGQLSILIDGVVDIAGWLGHRAKSQWGMATGDIDAYWREKKLADESWASTKAKFEPDGAYFARMTEYGRAYEALIRPPEKPNEGGKPTTTKTDNTFTGPITIKVTAERLGIRYESTARTERRIINALKGTERLLLIDEAHSLAVRSLNVIRDIHDEAKVPIVLAGTIDLRKRTNDSTIFFGQFTSRMVARCDVSEPALRPRNPRGRGAASRARRPWQ